MAFSTNLIALFGVYFGEYAANKTKMKNYGQKYFKSYVTVKEVLQFFSIFFVCLILVYSIISVTGGLAKWANDPGEAFLNRAGSGHFVILSHFFTYSFAILSGYMGLKTRTKWPILFFIAWLVVSSPVHGSKGLMALYLFLLLLQLCFVSGFYL